MNNKLLKDLDLCRRIEKKHGLSYYFATRFFPKEQRLATYALYAFFRLPDEIVDSGNLKKAEENLKRWTAKWQLAYKKRGHEEAVLNAASWVFHKYQIPYEYSEAFLKSMLMDVSKKKYRNYAELEKYMYGSAAVVGLMMSHVIGIRDHRALAYAEKLGYAMQLTNFLRDIKEDLLLRGRIYLPQNELSNNGVTEEMLVAEDVNEEFVSFMKYQIQRARDLYAESAEGVKYLESGGRRAVRTATKLYSAILSEIERNSYDVFNKRASISFIRKIILLISDRIVN